MSPKVRLGNTHVKLPRSRIYRVIIGVALILGGLLGFLPVLGFWMVPLGLLVLSVDLPVARRWRRRLNAWLRQSRHENGKDGQAETDAAEERRTP